MKTAKARVNLLPKQQNEQNQISLAVRRQMQIPTNSMIHGFFRHSVTVVASLLLFFCFPVSSTRAQAVRNEGWISASRVDDVVHFFFPAPARIERFDLATRTWLPRLTLPAVRGAMTGAGVDEAGYYIGYEKANYRYDLQGTNEVFLLSTLQPAASFLTDGNLLLIQSGNGFTYLSKDNNHVISASGDRFFTSYVQSGASIARSINRVFGRSTGVSPSDIGFVSYTDAGTQTGSGDSPGHGSFPSALRTYVFPNEAKVMDDSGTIYATSSLAYVGSVGGSFDDATFHGVDVPIILRGATVTAYNQGNLPTGSAQLTAPGTRIFVQGQDVIVFRRSTSVDREIEHEIVSLASLAAPEPGQPVEPKGLPYFIDNAWLDKNGQILLFSKAHGSVFRWDPTRQSYGRSIPLLGNPDYAAYAPASHSLFLAYTSGLIRKLDLNDASPKELPFAQLAAAPRGLAAVDLNLMAGDASGAWMTHRIFNATGKETAARDWNYFSKEYVWSPINRRLYHFRDDSSPNDLLWETISPEGAIGEQGESPYHGDFPIQHPIRVSHNAAIVVIGSGVAFNGSNLTRLAGGLGNDFVDGRWTASDSYFWSLRSIAGQAQIQQWSGINFAPGLAAQWPGFARRVFILPDGNLLAISSLTEGVNDFFSPPTPSTYSFHLFSPQLELIAPEILAAPSKPFASTLTRTSVTLFWDDVSGELQYRVERKQMPDGLWTSLPLNGMSVTSITDSTVVAGNSYAYRVAALNGEKVSPTSEEAVIALAPAGPPTGLAVSFQGQFLQLSWSVVSGATGYRLERRLGDSGEWSFINELAANQSVAIDHSFTAGQRYTYRVATINAFGTGAFSEPVSFRRPASVPATPGFTEATPGPNFIVVRWLPVNFSAEYILEGRAAGVATAVWTTLTPPLFAATEFNHLGLTPQTRYEYRLSSKSEDGASPWSATKTYMTTPMPSPPVPSLISVQPSQSGQLTLRWSDVAFEDGFVIERMIDSGWREIARVPADSNSYADNGLTNQVTVCYRVRAFNTSMSGFSASVCGTPSELVCVGQDNFSTGPLPFWAKLSGGQKTEGIPGLRDGASLWFGLAGPRLVESRPFELGPGSLVKFAFRAGNQLKDGEVYWNDSEPGESVVLEWSADGSAWNLLHSIDTTNFASESWVNFSLPIPLNAQTQSTRLRWRQVSHTGPSYDTWALDDVCLFSTQLPPPPAPPFLSAEPGLLGNNSAIILHWLGTHGSLVFDLERTADGREWVGIATGIAQEYYYDSTRLEGDLRYRVRARNSGGGSDWSPIITTRIPSSPVLDDQVGMMLKLTREVDGTVHFYWPSRAGKRYQLQASEDLTNWLTLESGLASGTWKLPTTAATAAEQLRFFRVMTE